MLEQNVIEVSATAQARGVTAPQGEQLAFFAEHEIAEHALSECQRYHPPRDESFPYVTWNWREKGVERMRQKAAPVSRLSWLISQIPTRRDWRDEHHYIVQNEFSSPNRRALNLWSFGLLWADLDLRHSEGAQACTAHEIDGYASRLLLDCEDHAIPEPSLVVWSGRGMQAKWLLDRALPAQALPRWTAAMRGLSAKLAQAGWTMDKNAMDVSRILRIAGTYNPSPGSSGFAFVAHEGQAYDFDYLCDWLLPYSREQVKQFAADSKARAEALEEARRAWSQFDENRRKAESLLGRTVRHAVQAAQEAEQSLHWRRLEVIRQAALTRGGIAPGRRNEWLWIASNSLAWGLGDAGKLWLELPQLAHEIAPSMTWPEAQNSASSVYARLKQGGRDSLYRFKTDTLIERLGLTPDEARGLRGGGHGTKNPGAMNLDNLRDLDFEEWRAAVHQRFRAGAGYTNANRPPETPRKAGKASGEARADASAGLREMVRKLYSAGTPVEDILNSLPNAGIHRATVWRWCRDLPRQMRGGIRRK
jgi:hypothetical protein